MDNEIEIIWLENPDKYRYLREAWVVTRTPRCINKKILGSRDKLIGYSVHQPDGSRFYKRRIWYLSPWDLVNDPGTPYAINEETGHPDWCPLGAVVPSSIRIGKPSDTYSSYITKNRERWRTEIEEATG